MSNFKFIRCDMCKTGLAEYFIATPGCYDDGKPVYYCHDCKMSFPPYTHPNFVEFDPYVWGEMMKETFEYA